MLIAHSENDDGNVHGLEDHLLKVADLALGFASVFDAGELAYFCGLAHDMGKAHPDVQKYLRNEIKRGPNHSAAGAFIVSGKCDLLTLPIAGHHAGLPSPTDLRQRLSTPVESKNSAVALEQAKTALSPLLKQLDASPELPMYLLTPSQGIELKTELFIRMIFSCLTDADFLDTETHFSPNKTLARVHELSMKKLWQRFQQDQKELSGQKRDALNRSRHEIYNYCLQAAEWEPGIFSLTVPTGGGKTRSSLAFALRHAIKYDLNRIIVAIPYTSIIEQTADVYRDILGSEAILEHHSAVNVEEGKEGSEEEFRSNLMSENWDASIIVTTTVQLFESLFSNRSSRCRKLHNIAGSVLILDEVQTLPTHLLKPTLDILQQLVDHYRVSVVLCTATQPALEKGPIQEGLRNVRQIVKKPQRYFSALKRVNYEFPFQKGWWSWEQMAQILEHEKQALVVLNTKKDALALLDVLGPEENIFHLSTLLCGAHRRAVLAEIRHRLNNNLPCRVVSTQVIEAGVDLDFPIVFRAVGPLDRIIQAAGRCNREGKMQAGRVIVFSPCEGKIPQGSYRSGADVFSTLVQDGNNDLNDLNLIRTYFSKLYEVAELDRKNIQKLRQQLDYPQVAARFRLIEQDTELAIVPYRPDIDKIQKHINQLCYAGPSRQLLRLIQPYVVSINKRSLMDLQKEQAIKNLAPGVWEWLGGYDLVRGIVSIQHDPANLIG
ncbi:MAG: CRISPR-associated helicase Cas3' [bacterium]|jgi:CRISPR-associated endonuclease/helicase Cas3